MHSANEPARRQRKVNRPLSWKKTHLHRCGRTGAEEWGKNKAKEGAERSPQPGAPLLWVKAAEPDAAVGRSHTDPLPNELPECCLPWPSHCLFSSALTSYFFIRCITFPTATSTMCTVIPQLIRCSFSLLSYPVFPPQRDPVRHTITFSRFLSPEIPTWGKLWGIINGVMWNRGFGSSKNLLFVWPARAAEGLACVINYNNGRSLKWTRGSNVWSRVW